MRKTTFFLTLGLLGLCLRQIRPTNAFFKDQIINRENIFKTSCWKSPDVPILTFPESNQTIFGSNVAIRWLLTSSSCPEADVSYEYQISGIGTFLTKDLSVNLKDLLPGSYSWKVRAKDQFDHYSLYSSPRIFTLVQTIHPRDVVINEIFWTGSYEKQADILSTIEKPEDVWVELRNRLSYALPLNRFKLDTGQQEIIFPALDFPAGSYFLISRFDENISRLNKKPDLVWENLVLPSKDLQMKLYFDDNLIDTASYDFGYHGVFFHFSMARKDDPTDGWFTSLNQNNSLDWDEGYWLSGTPGGSNLNE